MDLAKRAIRSVMELGALNVVHYGLTFLVQIVLARLLTPAIFGTVTLAASILGILNLTSKWGMPEAIMQDRDEEAVFSTIFWLRVVYAFAITAFVFAVSVPLASVYDSDTIFVLYVLTLANLLVLTSGTFEAPIQRDFRLRQLGLARLFALVAASAVSVYLALRDWGLWSLVAFYVVQDLAQALARTVVTPEYPRLRFSRETAAWFAGFAYGIMKSKLLNVAEDRGDDFLVGTLGTSVTLGLYHVAWQLSWAFKTAIQPAIMKGIVPTFGRFEDDTERSREGMEFLTRMQLHVAIPGYLVLVMVAPEFVGITFGDQWLGAVPALRVMTLAGVLVTVISSGRGFYYTRNEPGTVIHIQKYYLLTMLVLLVALVPTWGVRGAAVAISATQFVGSVLLFGQLRRDIGYRVGRVLPYGAGTGAVAAVVGVVVERAITPSTGPVGRVIVTAIAVGVVFYGLLYLVGRDTVRSDLTVLYRALGGTDPGL